MKMAVWTSAMATLTPDPGRTTAPRDRRQPQPAQEPLLPPGTSVSAAPNIAPVAIAQPSRPGVMYWIVFSDSSSTCSASSENVGGCPVAARLAADERVEDARTVPASTWSAAE